MRFAFVPLAFWAVSVAAPAISAVTTYTNRSSFLTALGNLGQTSSTETFDQFTSDVSFRDSPVDLNGFSLTGSGAGQGNRNIIDAVPVLFTGVNGTTQVEIYAYSDSSVQLTFAAPVNAFGFDALDLGDLAGTRITFGNQSFAAPVEPSFLGYISDDLFTTVTFTGSGDGFSIDNITYSPARAGTVPEPASWAMMIVGFGAIGATMRRRKVVFSQA